MNNKDTMRKELEDLFPYEPRKNQGEIVDDIYSCLDQGVSMVYQAATGSGKTVCTLTPVLEYADKHDKKVLYLTRTNSQQKQVINELRTIGGFYGLGLQGRNNTCLLALNDEELLKGTADELSKYCSDRKKEVIEAYGEGKKNYSCPYYGGLLECDIDDVRGWCKDNIPTVDEFLDHCRKNNICAYEMGKALIPDALLVTAPYIYFFMPFIRRRLLEWWDVEMDDLIVVVDEAHNLPDYARELASGEISTITLERAIGEGREFGDPDIYEDIKISTFTRLLLNILLDIVDEFVVDEDGLIPPNELRTELLHTLGLNTQQFKSLIKDLKIHGEIVQQNRRDAKKLPRSYIHSLAEFLSFWISVNRAEYIKLVNGGDNPSLEGFCLDPSRITEALNHCWCSIHQSATLEPMDEYKDSIGLPYDSEVKIYGSPFPDENKFSIYKRGITTQYEA
ncbi:MAG: DEAD/DEAH box helicase, partial [Thermoplasmata archaeon]